MKAEFYESGNIEGHMALVKRAVDRSVEDPETVQLAGKIVSNAVDFVEDPRTGRREEVIQAWGERFWPSGMPTPAAKNDAAELGMIHAFLVQNVRYVYDPEHADTFKTLKQCLHSRAGDCFPQGTLMLRDDGQMVPVEQLSVGDFVHDGVRFVEVLKTWDRGPKTIHRIGLNNANTLRLSDTHKVLTVHAEGPLEVRVSDLTLGADLLQPREFGGGAVELAADDAVLVAAYLAEGYTSRDGYRIGISGVAAAKGVREEVVAILESRGVPVDQQPREVRFAKSAVPILDELDLGRIAIEKHLPHLDWGPRTVRTLLAILDRTDGGKATNGVNVVYSSISYTLALQYRVLQRMMGRSTSLKCVVDHGGAGTNPIYRVMARVDHQRRPWARVRSLLVEPEEVSSYDIMTTSGRVYLPESDVVVRQCDDIAIAFCALARSVGFGSCYARVISMSGESWEHVYPIIGCPKDNPRVHIPFELTEAGMAPGTEVQGYKSHRDFLMSSY